MDSSYKKASFKENYKEIGINYSCKFKEGDRICLEPVFGYIGVGVVGGIYSDGFYTRFLGRFADEIDKLSGMLSYWGSLNRCDNYVLIDHSAANKFRLASEEEIALHVLSEI